MKPTKSHFLIIAVIAFLWLGLIIWGMFKTTSKLAAKKNSAAEKSSWAQTQSNTPKNVVSAKTTDTGPKSAVKKEGTTTTPDQKTAPPPSRSMLDQLKERVMSALKKKEEPLPPPIDSTTSTEPGLVMVRTFAVSPQDFNDQLPVMGTIKAKAEIPLKFEINGVISKINFREGEKIKKGDIIMELDPKDMQFKFNYTKNKLNSAQASYNSALKKLEVHQKLYDAGAIIKSKLEEVQLDSESAKFQVETARSEMELAENELKKIALYANKDGVMGKREAEEGEFVTPQDTAASFYEISEVYVEVGIVERDIDKVKLGQKAQAFVDAHPSTVFEGIIENIYPTVEGKSRTLTAKIKVDNANGMLMPGMFSRAEIAIIELKNTIIVPATCIITTGKDSNLIPVISPQTIIKTDEETETGVVQLRKVKIGYATTDYAQVEEGLNDKDLVVLEAQGELKDNTKVKIIGKEELSF